MGWLITLACIGVIELAALILMLLAVWADGLQRHAELMGMLSQLRVILTASKKHMEAEASNE